MVPISIVITIVTLTFSAGMAVGMFTAKFVSKKQCAIDMSQIKSHCGSEIDKVWSRMDTLQDCMTGGKILFELRPVKREE